MARTSFLRWSWVLAGLLAASCGGGGSSAGGDTLSGVVTTDRFVLPAGQVRRVDGDLTIRASQSIRIEGSLLVDEGVEVNLLSEDELLVAKIMPSGSLAAPTRQGGPSDWLWSGRQTELTNGVQAPRNTNINVAARGNQPTFRILGDIVMSKGTDAKTGGEAGGAGGSFHVGGPALALAQARGIVGSIAPQTLTVAAKITAGDGGNGWSDLNAGGEFAASLNPTSGGAGGSITLQAGALNIGNGVPLTAGKGGPAGWAGRTLGAASGFRGGGNGNTEAAPGGSCHVIGGRGGHAGQATVDSPQVNGSPTIPVVAGGQASSVFINGGRGGPGAPSNGVSLHLYPNGNRSDGTPTPGVPKLHLQGAANGGNGSATLPTGGAGGDLEVSLYGGPEPDLILEDSLRGGNGFDGCSVNPVASGGYGGNAGKVTSQRLPAIGANALKGGDAGDYGRGNRPNGGKGGFHNATEVGQPGFAGHPCSEVSRTLLLEHNLVYGGQTLMTAGSTVSVKRFRGFRISGPEGGCTNDHMHGTVFFDGLGPIEDPNMAGCGFGPVE